MMASHQALADFIKKVHIDLRKSSRQLGAEAAWKNHCHNSELLEKYAASMRDLATSFWEKNNAQNPNLNRIYWVVKECENFYRTGQTEAREKEQKLHRRYFGEDSTKTCSPVTFPISMLDVGSCYNPFNKFDFIKVTAIDIAPATSDVIKCDFLAANVGDFEFLVAGSYDVVLFSFLLEYLPHPKMRYDCCQKAYDLLKPGGILIVLTPDSKHDSANSGIMKSWRQGLASIGFLRTNFQKLKHLRCMTFYKCVDPRVAVEWLNREQPSVTMENSIVIPQDLNPYSELNEEPFEERTDLDNNVLVQSFAGLAGDDVFSD
uniref:S-adenosylmethionine sensor upstream of mTORC1 n=1 Tax=Lygus hesperus TaxID=30085 RepID=A0A146M7H3_LYGHE